MNWLIALIALIFSNAAVADDWAADWLEGSISSGGPTYYSGATRGYLSAGNLSYRVRNDVDYPLTISAPRIKTMGCGGVDMFMGGISFMDLDMLVEKFEQMIQNGEVIAFQLAIKALSEKLGTTVEGVEAILNKINNIQLDSCAMAKGAVTTVFNGGTASDAMGEVWSEVSQGQDLSLGGFKNAYDRAVQMSDTNNTPASTTDISREINACPAVVKQSLLVEGSALDLLTSSFGMSIYSEVFRGYIGDIFITHDGPGSLPNIQKIPPCRENDVTSSDDLVYGNSYARPSPTSSALVGTCFQNDNSLNLLAITEGHLTDLITALKDPTTPLASFDGLEDWLSSAPFPVYGIMQQAVTMGIEQEVSLELQNMLAYAYAYQMFDDMYKVSSRSMRDLTGSLTSSSFDETQAGGDDNPKCNLKPYMHIIKGYEEWAKTIDRQHKAIRQQYLVQIDAMQNRMTVLSKYQSVSDKNKMKILGSKQ